MDEKIKPNERLGETRLSRRTVAKGVAWSVPAVLALGTTPAYAGSQGSFAFSSLTPAKIDNDSTDLTAAGTGPDGATITVTLGEWSGTSTVTNGAWSVTIPAGSVPSGRGTVTALSDAWSSTKTYSKDAKDSPVPEPSGSARPFTDKAELSANDSPESPSATLTPTSKGTRADPAPSTSTRTPSTSTPTPSAAATPTPSP